MPTLKINDPRVLDEQMIQLPWHAAMHTLRLCEQHLSEDTWAKICRSDTDYNALPDCGGGLLVQNLKDTDPHINRVVRMVRFDGLSGCNIVRIPKDLRDCIIFAASLGFNGIEFETFDEQDCPLTEHLPAYPRSYNPNPKTGTYLKYLHGSDRP